MRVYLTSLPRTATTSVAAALGILGFVASHAYTKEWSVPAAVEGGTDLPFCDVFERLYYEYDDSYFLYVDRRADSWLRSFKRHRLPEYYATHVAKLSTSKPLPPTTAVGALSCWRLFGTPPYTDARLLKSFVRHRERVFRFFNNETQRFMSVPLSELGWGPLCDFLGRPLPGVPFPVLNKHGACCAG